MNGGYDLGGTYGWNGIWEVHTYVRSGRCLLNAAGGRHGRAFPCHTNSFGPIIEKLWMTRLDTLCDFHNTHVHTYVK